MLDQEKARSIFDRVLKFSSVPEVEVSLSSTEHALTRFANNTIHQNVAEVNEAASIRVAFDGKTARATTNRFDDEGLKRAVQSAESIARVQEPDSDFLPMANASEGKGPEDPHDGLIRQPQLLPLSALRVSAKLLPSPKRTSW
jgi:predicted Zn-dependent protease